MLPPARRARTGPSLMRSFDPRAVALYAYTYGADPDAVRPAALLRADAMDVSDRWVADGCDPAAPTLAEERALLVRSYA